MAPDQMRGLDHVVHAVRDLDAAAELYRRIGFTVGARNRHPWGTHNYIVQCPGFFIELLTLAEPKKLGSDGFSTLFAAYTRDFVARHDGLALLILESQNAEADVAAYRADGIGIADTLHFEREGQRPDGTAVKVGFSLAFAQDKGAPEIHTATCQQHYPENFWNPAFQHHANGVTGIAGVVMVAEQPAQHREFLLAFTGVRETRGDGDGFAIDLPRGAIDVMTPSAFTRRYSVAAPATAQGARLAALRFAVANPGLAHSRLNEAGLTSRLAGSGAVCAEVMGAVLAFEPGH